jgi:hypothetical protein
VVTCAVPAQKECRSVHWLDEFQPKQELSSSLFSQQRLALFADALHEACASLGSQSPQKDGVQSRHAIASSFARPCGPQQYAGQSQPRPIRARRSRLSRWRREFACTVARIPRSKRLCILFRNARRFASKFQHRENEVLPDRKMIKGRSRAKSIAQDGHHLRYELGTFTRCVSFPLDGACCEICT